MKDFSKFKLPPAHAEGRVCIDLKDPDTGKVLERVKGKNHIYKDSLFTSSWVSKLNSIQLLLTDNGDPVDDNFPYILGNIIGYGIPSNSGSGNYQGAYNSANQILSSMTEDSVRWKFQYDFTTAQANGTIRSIGLSNQCASTFHYNFSYYEKSLSTGYNEYSCDGRYVYLCSTAGVITVYDCYLAASTTIDMSSVVGTNSSEYKKVGYAPATGKFYIHVYNSSDSSSRYLYEFTDNTFTTLSHTYSVSNIGTSAATFYVYGNYMFMSRSGGIRYADFVNNTAYVSVSNAITDTEGSSTVSNYYPSCCYDKYILISYSHAAIFDMSQKCFVGRCFFESSSYPIIHVPASNKLFGQSNNTFRHNNAVTKYVLPTPVVKTSDKGMTVTYELEVFW